MPMARAASLARAKPACSRATRRRWCGPSGVGWFGELTLRLSVAYYATRMAGECNMHNRVSPSAGRRAPTVPPGRAATLFPAVVDAVDAAFGEVAAQDL